MEYDISTFRPLPPTRSNPEESTKGCRENKRLELDSDLPCARASISSGKACCCVSEIQ